MFNLLVPPKQNCNLFASLPVIVLRRYFRTLALPRHVYFKCDMCDPHNNKSGDHSWAVSHFFQNEFLSDLKVDTLPPAVCYW